MRKVCRRDRPGHDQHALHDLRSCGQRGLLRSAGARADLPASPAGSSRAPMRSGSARRGDQGRAARRAISIRRTSPPSASPTSARRRWSGTGRPASRCTTRSSGRIPAPMRSSTSCRARAARTASAPKSACRWRPISPARRSRWILDNVAGARAAGRARRAALRQHRHLPDLVADRRAEWRRAHHRCDQCLPHAC